MDGRLSVAVAMRRVGLALMLAMLAGGCAAVRPPEMNSYDFGANVPAAPTGGAAAAASQPSYTVELRPLGGQPSRVTLPIDGVPYVQNALESSGARRKFRRMNIEVFRMGPGGERQRLGSRYDPVKRTVPIDRDYALFPGDVVLVEELPAGLWSETLQAAFGDSLDVFKR